MLAGWVQQEDDRGKGRLSGGQLHVARAGLDRPGDREGGVDLLGDGQKVAENIVRVRRVSQPAMCPGGGVPVRRSLFLVIVMIVKGFTPRKVHDLSDLYIYRSSSYSPAIVRGCLGPAQYRSNAGTMS